MAGEIRKRLPGMHIKQRLTHVSMRRMSLFYILVDLYSSDHSFKSDVVAYCNEVAVDAIDMLTDLAGFSDGVMFELKITK